MHIKCGKPFCHPFIAVSRRTISARTMRFARSAHSSFVLTASALVACLLHDADATMCVNFTFDNSA